MEWYAILPGSHHLVTCNRDTTKIIIFKGWRNNSRVKRVSQHHRWRFIYSGSWPWPSHFHMGNNRFSFCGNVQGCQCIWGQWNILTLGRNRCVYGWTLSDFSTCCFHGVTGGKSIVACSRESEFNPQDSIGIFFLWTYQNPTFACISYVNVTLSPQTLLSLYNEDKSKFTGINSWR